MKLILLFFVLMLNACTNVKFKHGDCVKIFSKDDKEYVVIQKLEGEYYHVTFHDSTPTTIERESLDIYGTKVECKK